VIAVAALAAAFVLPAQAMATSDCSNVGSDPTEAQYCSPTNGGGGNEGTSTSVSVPSSDTAGVSTSSGGSLPFTGLDLAALLAVAGALTAAGFALRRLSGPSRH
jgi:hypothetical protein